MKVENTTIVTRFLKTCQILVYFCSLNLPKQDPNIKDFVQEGTTASLDPTGIYTTWSSPRQRSVTIVTYLYLNCL